MAEAGPMIRLGDATRAPVLDYNVPEPTSYTGLNFIEVIDESADIWTAAAWELPETSNEAGSRRDPIPDVVRDALRTGTLSSVAEGLSNRTELALRWRAHPESKESDPLTNARNDGTKLYEDAVVPRILRPRDLSPEMISANLEIGRRPVARPTMWGDDAIEFVTPPASARPRIVLIEKYKLSSYLGSYGAGRIVKTLSLLPGESTRISIKTYRKSEREAKDSSSILDSFTQESSDDFETSVLSESSEKTSQEEHFKYRAEAQGEATWGWGKATASAGIEGGSASAREEFAKNVSSSTEKHASKASAKRDVQVNTSTEVRESEGEETSIERTVENINVSRTLNFIFRQMNQEFVSVLHLVDVRVGFFNGSDEVRTEVPLSQIDRLLNQFVQPEHQAAIRKEITTHLGLIYDETGSLVSESDPPFIEEVDSPAGSYLRINRNHSHVIKLGDSDNSREISVRGVVTNVTRSVLRTDGIIVEAILGQAEALDRYSQGLQETAIEEKHLGNQMKKLSIKRQEAALDILKRGDHEAAKVFATLFPPEVEKQEILPNPVADGDA